MLFTSQGGFHSSCAHVEEYENQEHFLACGASASGRQEWESWCSLGFRGPRSNLCEWKVIPAIVKLMDEPGDRFDDAEDPHEDDPVREGADLSDLTDSKKALVKRLHDNMGHPAPHMFYRTLRLARASPAVLKFVKEKFSCEACKARPLPKPSRPATAVRG